MAFNLSVLVREAAGRSPDHPALVHDGGRMSYAELRQRADRIARSLVDLGLQPGDAVGLQLPNVPEFVELLYGVFTAGGVVVPMNPLNKAPEIAYFLEHSGARVLVTGADTAEEASAGLDKAGGGQLFVVGEGALPIGARPFTDLTAAGIGDTDDTDPLVLRQAEDTAVLLYTSGTTGKPKGVKLTHFQLYMNADAHRVAFEMGPDSVVIAVMPLFHALGLSGLMNATMLSRGTLRLLPKFDATRVLEVIQGDRATMLHGVPTMYHALLNHEDRRDYDLSSLRTCGSAGAAIPAEVLDAFEREFGVWILEMYGLTESGPLASYNRPDHRRAYSIGMPIWGTEIQIWNSENSQLPRGREHVGEIVIRGHNMMAGYLDNDAATAEAFAGGWLHSGDLGYIDEDGFLFIVDRKKELIIRGGYNVYPREVEEVVYQHPDVMEAAVIGVPDDRLGEEVAAFVTVRPGHVLTPEDVIDFVKERVAAYKYPRWVRVMSELPKGPTGKILKRELREMV